MINSPNKTKQFFEAVQGGDVATVTSLLDADPALTAMRNEQGQSAILVAVYHGRRDVRDLLIARGVSLDIVDAVAAGQIERVQQLVEKDRALADSFSPDGFPVFALAVTFGHKDVAEYLLSRGAGVNRVSTNPTGYTALTGAVAMGRTELVAWLLSSGANANHRYGPGYSPLHEAAANGRLEMVRLLVAAGADTAALTTDGKTPLAFAEERNHVDVAAFLRQRSAYA
ncbi:MAG TPA: ankyrin repeat domain-containing protein [Candidatus Dormibacteraeota bacterium]|nr:ankyrin repeat domain-containing protein [Candidatus Dormibacteraeota bacterium]